MPQGPQPSGGHRLAEATDGGARRVIDHIGLNVRDVARATEFYLKALAPLGYGIVMQVSAEERGGSPAVGFGSGQKPSFWIAQGERKSGPCMSRLLLRTARRSIPSMLRRSALAAKTMGYRDFGQSITPIITARSFSIPTATMSRRCATCQSDARGLVRPAIRQREGAGIGLRDRHLFSDLGILLRVIGTDNAVRREGHSGELAVVEDEARATFPVLVGFWLAERVLALVGLLLIVGCRHGAGARIVIDERFALCDAVTVARRAGAGDDLFLGHADIGLCGIGQEGALEGLLRRLATAEACAQSQDCQQSIGYAHRSPLSFPPRRLGADCAQKVANGLVPSPFLRGGLRGQAISSCPDLIRASAPFRPNIPKG